MFSQKIQMENISLEVYTNLMHKTPPLKSAFTRGLQRLLTCPSGIKVHKQGLGWVNMDSQAPNKVVGEWLAKQGYDYIKPEFTYGKSRIDFYMEKGEQKYLLEIKGCTLEVDGIGYFPDAPTERGVKHLHELAQAQRKGYQCAVAFVIQMEGITEVRPNVRTQPEFGTALAEAKAAGVQVLFLLCHVGRDSLEIVEQREG